MNKKEHKQRFALTLLVSCFVFVIITVAVLITVGIIYLLLKVGVIDSIDGQPNLSEIFVFMSLVSMVTGFLLTMLTGKLSLKSVNHMINQLNRLSEGDFKVRLKFGKPIGNHPTFREVEKSFNRAAEELEHTEMLRSDFVDNFSHEFKTPIVSIAGFAGLLRNSSLTEEQRQEYLAVIEEEALRLSNMATNVLNLTKVESQTILTDVSEFNLSEQSRSVVLLLADKWTQKKIDMDIDFGEHMICANEKLLKQIWFNLLDNAIKYSDIGCKITVKITEDENEISVAVSDHGKDIPPESIARIFNKFYQADESRSTEGNGIGIAIVKKVTDLHNGKVFAESGGGTTVFTVRLPAKQ